MNKKNLPLIIAVFFLASCSTPKVDSGDVGTLPSWVLMPTIENGLASSDCVKWSGNMSIDRKMAIANARANIAQQIKSSVKVLEETYSRRVDANEKTNVGNNFESGSESMTEESLSGTRATRVEPVQINNEQHLCVMVTWEKDITELFKGIVSDSGVSAEDEEILYEEFKAYKFHDKMDDKFNQ